MRDTPAYFATKLYKSMKGLGTDDATLIRVVVTRCEVDMILIKQVFQRLYQKTLASFIKVCFGKISSNELSRRFKPVFHFNRIVMYRSIFFWIEAGSKSLVPLWCSGTKKYDTFRYDIQGVSKKAQPLEIHHCSNLDV